MKTTQDNHMLLNQVASMLGYELISLTQYSDKSFQLDAYKADENKLIYSSDDAIDGLDINDFGYLGAAELANMISIFGQIEPKVEIPKVSIADQARARLNKSTTQDFTEL